MMLVAQILLCRSLRGSISQNLDETQHPAAFVVNGRKFAHRPKAAVVFSYAPSLIAAASAVMNGIQHFPRELPLFGEDSIEGLSQHLTLRPTQNQFSAAIPTRDSTTRVGTNDRGVNCAVDDLPPLRGENQIRSVRHRFHIELGYSRRISDPEARVHLTTRFSACQRFPTMAFRGGL